VHREGNKQEGGGGGKGKRGQCVQGRAESQNLRGRALKRSDKGLGRKIPGRKSNIEFTMRRKAYLSWGKWAEKGEGFGKLRDFKYR